MKSNLLTPNTIEKEKNGQRHPADLVDIKKLLANQTRLIRFNTLLEFFPKDQSIAGTGSRAIPFGDHIIEPLNAVMPLFKGRIIDVQINDEKRDPYREIHPGLQYKIPERIFQKNSAKNLAVFLKKEGLKTVFFSGLLHPAEGQYLLELGKNGVELICLTDCSAVAQKEGDKLPSEAGVFEFLMEHLKKIGIIAISSKDFLRYVHQTNA